MSYTSSGQQRTIIKLLHYNNYRVRSQNLILILNHYGGKESSTMMKRLYVYLSVTQNSVRSWAETTLKNNIAKNPWSKLYFEYFVDNQNKGIKL